MYGGELLHADLCHTCDTLAGSDIDRGSSLGRKCTFLKDTFQALQCTTASSRVACGWLESGCK